MSSLPWGFVVSVLLAMFFSLVTVQVKTVTERFAASFILTHNGFWCHWSPLWIHHVTEYRSCHIHCSPWLHWLLINFALLNKQYCTCCTHNLNTGQCAKNVQGAKETAIIIMDAFHNAAALRQLNHVNFSSAETAMLITTISTLAQSRSKRHSTLSYHHKINTSLTTTSAHNLQL